MDGSCVSNSNDCRLSVNCQSGFKLCEDGSCVPSDQECFNLVGCPLTGKTFWCANGQCINPKFETCEINP